MTLTRPERLSHVENDLLRIDLWIRRGQNVRRNRGHGVLLYLQRVRRLERGDGTRVRAGAHYAHDQLEVLRLQDPGGLVLPLSKHLDVIAIRRVQLRVLVPDARGQKLSALVPRTGGGALFVSGDVKKFAEARCDAVSVKKYHHSAGLYVLVVVEPEDVCVDF